MNQNNESNKLSRHSSINMRIIKHQHFHGSNNRRKQRGRNRRKQRSKCRSRSRSRSRSRGNRVRMRSRSPIIDIPVIDTHRIRSRPVIDRPQTPPPPWSKQQRQPQQGSHINTKHDQQQPMRMQCEQNGDMNMTQQQTPHPFRVRKPQYDHWSKQQQTPHPFRVRKPQQGSHINTNKNLNQQHPPHPPLRKRQYDHQNDGGYNGHQNGYNGNYGGINTRSLNTNQPMQCHHNYGGINTRSLNTNQPMQCHHNYGGINTNQPTHNYGINIRQQPQCDQNGYINGGYSYNYDNLFVPPILMNKIKGDICKEAIDKYFDE